MVNLFLLIKLCLPCADLGNYNYSQLSPLYYVHASFAVI